MGNLIETVNANHIETTNRLTALETLLQGIPDRVTALETSANTAKGGWSIADRIFTAACAVFTAIVAYLGFKHS